MIRITAVIALTALAICATPPAVAGEKAVARSAVPKAALDAVTRKYPRAKLLKFAREVEDKEVTFEVVLQDGDRKIDVDVSPDGKILAEEETIPRSALPEVVTKALAAHATYGKWQLDRAERVTKQERTDAPSYELVVTSGRKAAELVFDRDGKLVKVEPKSR